MASVGTALRACEDVSSQRAAEVRKRSVSLAGLGGHGRLRDSGWPRVGYRQLPREKLKLSSCDL